MFGAELPKDVPTKLAKEPLVDAVFEMRFVSDMPVSSIWPGILYSELPGDKSMEHLPALGIPKELRDADPNLVNIPLCKLSWGDYWILIGDRVFALAAKIPYPGWNSFLPAILETFGIVLKTNMIKSISRCSIKYVDILDAVPLEPSSCFNLELRLGGRFPQGKDFHVRLGVEEGEVTHTLQIASVGNAQLFNGQSVSGPVLDIDSVLSLRDEDAKTFSAHLEKRATQLHDANKQIIFDCLSAEALTFLGPSYE